MNEPADTDQEPREVCAPGRGLSWSSWWWGPGVFVLVYLLSVGPAVKLHKTCPRLRPGIEIVYSPLVMLCESSKPAMQAMRWYLEHVWREE
jgi:hypothetical protein